MPAKRLPSGGPLKLEAKVAAMCLAHIEAHCHEFGTKRQKIAAAERDRLMIELDDRQRRLALLLARKLTVALGGQVNLSEDRRAA